MEINKVRSQLNSKLKYRWKTPEPPLFKTLELREIQAESNEFYHILLNSSRFVIAIFVTIRFLIDEVQYPTIIYLRSISVSLFFIYILINFILIKQKKLFLSFDKYINAQAIVDALFYLVFYICTLQVTSHIFLLVAFPVFIASFKESFDIPFELKKLFFIFLLIALSIVLINNISPPLNNLSFLKFFMVYVWVGSFFFVSRIIYVDRKLFINSITTEPLMQAILSNVGELVLAINKKHEILWANDQLKKYYKNKYGNEMRSGEGIYCHEMFQNNDRICDGCLSSKAMVENRICEGTETWGHKDSSSFFHVTASPLKNDGGDIIGAVEVLLDITEKEHFQKMKEDQSFLHKILESNVEPIIATDKKGNILIHNKATNLLSGYSEEDLRNRIKCKDLYCNEEGSNGYEIAKEVMDKLKKSEDRRIRDYRSHLKTKDGSPIPVNVSATIIYGETEEIASIVGIFKDMRGYDKLMSDKLANERLAAVGGISSFLAHNVKGDLGTLLLDIESLFESSSEHISIEDKNRFEKSIRIIKRIDSEIKRIHGVIDVSIDRKTIEAKELAEKINSELESLCMQKHIKYYPQISSKLSKINADIEIIMRVFAVLWNNSFDALEKRERGAITLGMSEENGKLIVTWSDNGAGIPRDKHEKVFEPFYTTKEQGKGWGMGLTLAKGIMARHEATIHVAPTTQEGKGTTFILTFPTA